MQHCITLLAGMIRERVERSNVTDVKMLSLLAWVQSLKEDNLSKDDIETLKIHFEIIVNLFSEGIEKLEKMQRRGK